MNTAGNITYMRICEKKIYIYIFFFFTNPRFLSYSASILFPQDCNVNNLL